MLDPCLQLSVLHSCDCFLFFLCLPLSCRLGAVQRVKLLISSSVSGTGENLIIVAQQCYPSWRSPSKLSSTLIGFSSDSQQQRLVHFRLLSCWQKQPLRSSKIRWRASLEGEKKSNKANLVSKQDFNNTHLLVMMAASALLV